MEELPVHTLIGNENKIGSLLLCGLNHGYSKEDERQDNEGVDRRDEHKSFFSDKAVNDYPFRNNIVKWFALWGYNLIDKITNAGTFKKSIVQTNWLQTCSNNMDGINKQQACIDDSNSFIETCQAIKPSLIFFFSQELLWAFNSEQLSTKVESVFGKQHGLLSQPRVERFSCACEASHVLPTSSSDRYRPTGNFRHESDWQS